MPSERRIKNYAGLRCISKVWKRTTMKETNTKFNKQRLSLPQTELVFYFTRHTDRAWLFLSQITHAEPTSFPTSYTNSAWLFLFPCFAESAMKTSLSVSTPESSGGQRYTTSINDVIRSSSGYYTIIRISDKKHELVQKAWSIETIYHKSKRNKNFNFFVVALVNLFIISKYTFEQLK